LFYKFLNELLLQSTYLPSEIQQNAKKTTISSQVTIIYCVRNSAYGHTVYL